MPGKEGGKAAVPQAASAVESRRRAEANLSMDGDRFRQLAENIREVFFIHSAETGAMEYISPAYDEVWGRPGSGLYERPSAWLDSVHDEDRERVAGILANSIDGLPTEMEYRIVRPDGSIRWIHARSFPVRDDAGRCVRVVGIADDVTAWVEKERALREATAQLDRALRASREHAREQEALAEFLDLLQACQTMDEVYGVVAGSMPTLLGAEKGALGLTQPSRNLVEIVSEWGGELATRRTFEPHDCWGLRRGKANCIKDLRSPTRCPHVASDPPYGYLCIPLAAQGETIGILYVESPPVPQGVEPDEHGKALCRKATALGERMSLALANVRLREALRAQSIRDPLTGLFNRRYLEESLDREIRRAIRHNDQLAVLMIDIDRFKGFNDTFGHEGGDAALRAFGTFLAEHTRGQDVACRYGGEEFAIVLCGADSAAVATRAELMIRDLKQLDLRHAGRTLGPITVSIGGAVYPGYESGADLLRAADEALYRAKVQGRDRFVMA
ncbi:MAG: diguanylate cyclase [Gemmatimonadota bacterium]